MGKRTTQRRKTKIYSSKNGISSVNSANMFESCLPVPVLASDCQVSATHDYSAVGQRILLRKRCLKTNLGGNDTAFKNSSNVQDMCLSVRSSDNDFGLVGDKSDLSSRKIKFKSKLDLNKMSTENVLKVPATCESVKSVEIYTKLKHDNTENVASYATTQPIISRSIKMEVPRNDCITKHDQTFSTNNKFSRYRRKIRERKCKTCLNDVGFKNKANMSVASQSVQFLNRDSAKIFNYNHTQNIDIGGMKQLFIPIKDIKLEMPEYSSIIEHYQSIKTNENSAIVKRTSRERKCKTNLNKNDITADKSACMPILFPNAQVSDCVSEMIEPTDNSAIVRRKIRERKVKTNINQRDLCTENSSKMPNTSPPVQLYGSFGQNIATIDNYEMRRRKKRERKSVKNRKLNGIVPGISARKPDTCTSTQSPNLHHGNTRSIAKDSGKLLSIPVKCTKKKMLEYDSDVRHCQTIAKNNNSAKKRQKSKVRNCKTNHSPNDVHSGKLLSIPVKCTKKKMREYDSDVRHCQTIAKNNNSAKKRQKSKVRNCKTNHSPNDVHSENPSRKPDECPTAQAYEKYSKRFFHYSDTQNTAPDIKSDLITPVKRSKMEISKCNSPTERCQSIATDDYYAMNRRKSRVRKCKTKLNMRERLSENTDNMLCSCPPLSFDNDCRIHAATDDFTMGRRKNSERTFKAGQSVNNGNSAELPGVCPAALDSDCRRCFFHSNTQNLALNATKQLIILVKDIKMEIPENICVTQHCQSLATKGNYALDKCKSGERDISSENAATMLENCSSFQSLEMRCQNKVIKENNAEDKCKSETEDEYNPKQAKDFSSTADINNSLNNDSSIVHVEEREFSLENPKRFDFMTEKYIPINDNFIPSLKNTDCSEYIEAVESSIANDSKKFSSVNDVGNAFVDKTPFVNNAFVDKTPIANDSKKFSSVNDVGNAFVDKTPFVNFKKREISSENCRTSEYCKDESIYVIQGMTNNDECKINTKDDTETQTLATCSMSMKQNSEIEFKIKVTRKIKSSGGDCSNRRLNISNEQYKEKNIESKNLFINAKPESVSSVQSSPNECTECNYNVNTSTNDAVSILSGNDANCVSMDETSLLNNKKRGCSEIKNNYQGIMDKHLKEITNNAETKQIVINKVLNMSLKRGLEVGGNSEIARKCIKIENEINEKSDDIINPKIDNFHLLQCYPIECTENNRNADLSQIRNEPSSSGTSDCHSIVDEAFVFENVNIESGRDKNNFENAMHEKIHVKEEISNGDSETSIGTNDLPNKSSKEGVKSEISNSIKKAKSYFDNTNKLTVNEMHNRKVGSIQILQNLSREFDSVASSSETPSCSLIMNDTSTLNNKKRGTLEIKNNSQSIMDKSLKEITNNDETKPIAADNVLNVSLKRVVDVGRNSEIARKSIKIENEINKKSDDILINPKIDNFHLLQCYNNECTQKNGNAGSSQIRNEPSSSGTSDCHSIVDKASVFDNAYTESGRDKNNFENAIHKNFHVKEEISNGGRATSVGRDERLSMPPKGGVKSECSKQNGNAGSSQIHNEPSSSGTSVRNYIVNEASDFDNVNAESERDENNVENAMNKNIHVKEEISYEDRTTSIGTDDLPNTPPKGGVKSEISNNRKKTKSYIDNTNKSAVNEIQNTRVGSNLLLQNLSSEFNSEASSSGNGSCNLIMDETSVLDVNSKSLENKGIYEILELKNNHKKEKITNGDNAKPVQADTISNMLQKRNRKVEENTEVNIKRKKTEHDCSNTHENILQELHLHLDKQKIIVDMIRNITRDINVRLLQKSFAEMCNNEDNNSRCYTGVFSHGNEANFADVNINLNESILKNELSKTHNILRNVVDKTVVIKKETFNENEDSK